MFNVQVNYLYMKYVIYSRYIFKTIPLRMSYLCHNAISLFIIIKSSNLFDRKSGIGIVLDHEFMSFFKLFRFLLFRVFRSFSERLCQALKLEFLKVSIILMDEQRIILSIKMECSAVLTLFDFSLI